MKTCSTIAITALLAISCSSESKTDKEASEETGVAKQAKVPSDEGKSARDEVKSADNTGIDTASDESKAVVGLHVHDFDEKSLPTEFKFKGSVIAGLRFDDVKGQNWLVATERSETNVIDDPTFVDTLVSIDHIRIGKSGTLEQVRSVKAAVKECQTHNSLTIDPKSMGVFDLDNDGLGEIRIGYQMVCSSWVYCDRDKCPKTDQPLDKGFTVLKYQYKMMLLEDGEKYIVRSKFTQYGKAHKVKLKPQLDKDLKKAPKQFKENLLKEFKSRTKRIRSRWSDENTAAAPGFVPLDG